MASANHYSSEFGEPLPSGLRVMHTETGGIGTIDKVSAWEPTKNRPFHSYYVRWDYGGLGYVDGPFLRILTVPSEKEFDQSLRILSQVYEDGKSSLFSLSIIPEETNDYHNVFEVLKQLRDIAAVYMKQLYEQKSNSQSTPKN